MKKFRRFVFVNAIVLLLILGTPISAYAGDKPSGKPFEAIWGELKSLQRQIDDFQSQIDELKSQLENEIANRISRDEDLQTQIDDLQVKVDDLQAQVDDLKAQIDAEKEARIAADATLQDAIYDEVTARIAADDDLQDQIDNHKHSGEDITSGKIANARLNLGHGQGLDADTVDGMHASEFSSKWSESGSDIYYNDGNVGIGTASPLTNLYIEESSTLDHDMLTLYSNVNPGNKFGIVFGIGDGGRIEGGAIRFERSDAPGGGDLSFWTSPASGVDATKKMVISSDGNVGIGTSEPHGLLHGVGDTGGFMFWEFGGVDDNPITLIPDGPGDVERFLNYDCFALENTGPSGMSISGNLYPGGTAVLFNDGTDTLVMECALDGSVTIYRGSGSDTFEVVLWLMWI